MEGEAKSRPAWISSSYDFSTVVPESSRITYGGDSGSSIDIELLSNWFENVEAANFRVGDTGSRILLILPQVSAYLCSIDTRVPGRKVS